MRTPGSTSAILATCPGCMAPPWSRHWIDLWGVGAERPSTRGGTTAFGADVGWGASTRGGATQSGADPVACYLLTTFRVANHWTDRPKPNELAKATIGASSQLSQRPAKQLFGLAIWSNVQLSCTCRSGPALRVRRGGSVLECWQQLQRFTNYSYLGLFVSSLDDSYHVEKGNMV